MGSLLLDKLSLIKSQYLVLIKETLAPSTPFVLRMKSVNSVLELLVNEAFAAQGCAGGCTHTRLGHLGPPRLAVLMDFSVTYRVNAPNSSALEVLLQSQTP